MDKDKVKAVGRNCRSGCWPRRPGSSVGCGSGGGHRRAGSSGWRSAAYAREWWKKVVNAGAWEHQWRYEPTLLAGYPGVAQKALKSQISTSNLFTVSNAFWTAFCRQ
jgi:hypothetical protein